MKQWGTDILSAIKVFNIEKMTSLLKQFPEIIKYDHYHNFTDIQLKDEVIPSEFLKKLIGKIEINHFSIIEPTLNKIFIDLIKENSGSV